MYVTSQVSNGFFAHVDAGSKSQVPEKDIQFLTVERLRALLKEKGLSIKGKKASKTIFTCVV